MTDHVNLDELTTGGEREDDSDDGDWLSPENTAPGGDRDDGTAAADVSAPPGSPGSDDGSETVDAAANGEAARADPAETRVPHVPRSDKDKPVGIPKEGGGAGGAAGGESSAADGADADAASGSDAENAGPHGRGVDEMTLALTYEAATALANPSGAFADANRWADWIGIVGGVPAHVLNKFQRDHHLDLDFFNGSGMEPAERLADIDENSMFYAERLVLVGREGEEGIAERANWEFLPLSEAAEKAGWDHEGA
ncbi:DUF7124 domain-containing protein [Halobellus sp. EA9]|uniref:DUF7124 domain-containing protein n=1 Tax=Halobellus sp. EA9 TaxID=3421647 RepID=UPI003EB94ECB